ncbi:hypothetical protein [Streptomyces sp. NBC_00286]|uniref:hypothetical protein n=1 Tax=Streptomyces sp. NBC_00286 TaxID=2975701 RepID=UPI002E2E40E2|nr:hypothetical protein [Streptomyces sp. NBC_00286]
MAPLLTDMSSDRLDALIKHPFHRENGEWLVSFIQDLRQCHGAEDFVAFQRELLHATLARWLGHSSPAITLGYYAHFMPEAGSKRRTAIDGLLGE